MSSSQYQLLSCEKLLIWTEMTCYRQLTLHSRKAAANMSARSIFQTWIYFCKICVSVTECYNLCALWRVKWRLKSSWCDCEHSLVQSQVPSPQSQWARHGPTVGRISYEKTEKTKRQVEIVKYNSTCHTFNLEGGRSTKLQIPSKHVVLIKGLAHKILPISDVLSEMPVAGRWWR